MVMFRVDRTEDVLRHPGLAASEDLAGLRAAYAAYRERQARLLVSMLPREAVRPLYRAAHAAHTRALPDADRDFAIGELTEGDVPRDGDPLDLLVRHCATFLPLPPFEVWYADLMRHPEAHLAEWAEGLDGPPRDAPVTLATRAFDARGRSWQARLRGFHELGAWRGFIAFELAEWHERAAPTVPEAATGHRTAAIFREDDPEALRTRFLDFGPAALSAFLRSCLP